MRFSLYLDKLHRDLLDVISKEEKHRRHRAKKKTCAADDGAPGRFPTWAEIRDCIRDNVECAGGLSL